MLITNLYKAIYFFKKFTDQPNAHLNEDEALNVKQIECLRYHPLLRAFAKVNDVEYSYEMFMNDMEDYDIQFINLNFNSKFEDKKFILKHRKQVQKDVELNFEFVEDFSNYRLRYPIKLVKSLIEQAKQNRIRIIQNNITLNESSIKEMQSELKWREDKIKSLQKIS